MIQPAHNRSVLRSTLPDVQLPAQLLKTKVATVVPPCGVLQLYSVALYVEGELASKELGIRYRGGFFETDDDYCSALVDGAFDKVLVVSIRGATER